MSFSGIEDQVVWMLRENGKIEANPEKAK